MKPNGPSAASIVRPDQKLAQMSEFVSAFLMRPRTPGSEITLLARSASSPVAQALRGLGDVIAAKGISVRAILTHTAPDATGFSWAGAAGDLPFARRVHLADDPRLLDAHEQLVLDARTSWIGDCLRRDPEKRDAYEMFAADCARTAATAARSFNLLWRATRPLVAVAAPAVVEADTDIVPPLPVDAERRDGDTSGARH
jgi:hypothetical protein